MLKLKIIAILSAAMLLLSAAAAAEEIDGNDFDTSLSNFKAVGEVQKITFDEAATISGVRNISYFDFDAGTGTLSIGKNDVGENKNSAVFTSKGNTKTQINGLWARVPSGVITVEGDFLFSDFNAKRTIFTSVVSKASGTATGSSFVISAEEDDGKATVGGKNIPLLKDTWYRFQEIFNLYDKTIDYYIDNVHIHTSTLATDISQLQRVTVQQEVPPEGEAVMYFDNYMCKKYVKPIEAQNITVNNGVIEIDVSESLDAETVTKENFIISCNGNNEVIDEASYDSDNKRITLKPLYPLYSAIEYEVKFSTAIKSVDAIGFSDSYTKKFTTQAQDFDVTDVTFIKEGSKTGVRANLQNNTTDSKTAVMVMVLRNADNVIMNFFSSAKGDIIGNENELKISPIESEGMSAEVFFIDSWESCLPIKNFLYKN